jgi:hypothetical protein
MAEASYEMDLPKSPPPGCIDCKREVEDCDPECCPYNIEGPPNTDIAACNVCGKMINKDQAASWSELLVMCRQCNGQLEKRGKAIRDIMPILLGLFDPNERNYGAMKATLEEIVREVISCMCVEGTPFPTPKVIFKW